MTKVKTMEVKQRRSGETRVVTHRLKSYGTTAVPRALAKAPAKGPATK